jgi:DNA-binding NarL/FixJ family response regulator
MMPMERNAHTAIAPMPKPAQPDGERSTTHLTPTQIKVLRGVHSGQLNKEIAYDLGIAEATVKGHITTLMRKLNVRNRTQAAIAAQRFPLSL